VNDLTHLDLAGAASSNLLLVLAIPMLVVAWTWWLRREWREHQSGWRVTHSSRWAHVALALVIVFSILRNLPGPLGGWLAA
jgi:uncharacterized membrane protein YidH (DUF202 family)